MKGKSNKNSCSKAEVIFYTALAIVTLSVLFWYILRPSQGNLVEVRVSGKIIGTYKLNENQQVTIKGRGEGENILTIKDGKAKMEKADCPDKICVKYKEIYRVSESIICLPHEIVVEIKKNDLENNEAVSEQKEDDVDVIAK